MENEMKWYFFSFRGQQVHLTAPRGYKRVSNLLGEWYFNWVSRHAPRIAGHLILRADPRPSMQKKPSNNFQLCAAHYGAYYAGNRRNEEFLLLPQREQRAHKTFA